MSDAEKESDTEGKEGGKGKAKSKSGGGNPQMKLVIVGAVALFVAVLGAQVAAPLLTKVIEGGSHKAAKADAKEHEEGEADAIELAAADPEKAEKPEKKEPAQYVPLDPPFVVSYDEEDGTRYLQLQLQAMARSEKTIEEIKKHAPALRNAFLLQLSGYKLEEMTTLEGKEKLRAALTKSANEVLTKNGSEGQIEELYFTNLVIQ
jgi:flagellar protein FliL